MQHIYADDVADLQMNSTSVRFTLVQADGNGGFRPVGRVILPARSAPEVFKAMADGLTDVVNQIREKKQAE